MFNIIKPTDENKKSEYVLGIVSPVINLLEYNSWNILQNFVLTNNNVLKCVGDLLWNLRRFFLS